MKAVGALPAPPALACGARIVRYGWPNAATSCTVGAAEVPSTSCSVELLVLKYVCHVPHE